MPLLFLSVQAFGQSSATLSGTVLDTSRAVLPGATVTATNVETGVEVTIVSNDSGVYTFAALQPGTYTIKAEMPGFQTSAKTDVRLVVGQQARLNFELNVAGVETSIEVTTTGQDILLEAGSSTGTVLEQKTAAELPLVGNDAMQLINVMGGVVKPEDSIFGGYTQTFAGVSAANVNIQRDGITVNEVRYSSGVTSPARLNQEMIGEFKMVLAPVDAEMGRGSGQVQVLTKSGSNDFHGSAVWSVMNTALDANEWDNNRKGLEPDWRNVNEYSLSTGGPIVKNKTFFFVSWNQQIARSKQSVVTPVLTPCARKGIFRYFPGWDNGNVDTVINTDPFSIPIRPSVTPGGDPLTPNGDPSGGTLVGHPMLNNTAYQGMQFFSVLGQLTPEAQQAIALDPVDCSNYLPAGLSFDGTSDNGLVAGSNWDANRKAYDPTGYIARFSNMMPVANDYTIGDGLNVAGHRWVRTTSGADSVFGSGQDNQRKAITVKIDHNINAAHRLSGTYSYESNYSSGAEPTWPNAFGGAVVRKPQTFTTTLTSTLRPTLLNEFRVGLSRTETHNQEPLANSKTGQQMADLLDSLMSTKGWENYDGFPLVIGPGAGQASFVPDVWSAGGAAGASNPYGSRGILESTWGGVDPRWTFADTMTWIRGSHSFKGGVEVRLAQSKQDSNGWAQFIRSSNTFPYVQGGNTPHTPPSGLTNEQVAGLVGSDNGNSSNGTYGRAYNLMSYMAGSVGVIRQFYFVNSATQQAWNDPTKGELTRVVDMRQREFSLFFKDDWKVNNSLTLNLGLRYEYYGLPWVDSGMTAGVVGGAEKLFSASGDFSGWMPADPTYDIENPVLTELHFIGPNSPNPDLRPYRKDFNNFGPAVGFSWQLPWFGKGKTTLRGGYQLTYVPIANADPNTGFGLVLAQVPGTIYPHEYTGQLESRPYMDMTMLPELVPTAEFIDQNIKPLATRPYYDRSQSLTVYDPNIRNPYIQSLTLSLTRQIGSNLTVDVRYIGTLSRKQVAGMNLNSANFINNGLVEALDIARAGGESELLDRLIQPFTLWMAASGAEQLRTYFGTNTNLATGNYAAVASTLATANGNVNVPSGTSGAVLRASNTPENFIYTNPQFSAANWQGNLNHSNYHSMQAQATLRPTRGLSFQTTYTWSRNLGIGTIADVHNRDAAYGILGMHRSHQLTSFGTYELPFGANGFLFRDSSGTVKKLIEGWQLSWIGTITSGMPASVTTVNSMWAGGMPDLVRPDLFDTKGGQVTWEPGADHGLFYGNRYVAVEDPQCWPLQDNGLSPQDPGYANTMRGRCASNLKALALASDPSVIVFQHAKPGVKGNFDPNQLTGPGRWTFDLAMSKRYEFMEGKSFTVRVDAQNIFNHPTPSGANGFGDPPLSNNARDYQISNPVFNLNSSDPFGYIQYKGGHRVFSAKLRFDF